MVRTSSILPNNGTALPKCLSGSYGCLSWWGLPLWALLWLRLGYSFKVCCVIHWPILFSSAPLRERLWVRLLLLSCLLILSMVLSSRSPHCATLLEPC